MKKSPTTTGRSRLQVHNLSRMLSVSKFSLFTLFLMFTLTTAGSEIWPMDRPTGMPNIVSLEVMCGKDHMDVHLKFSHAFDGIVSSKGQHSDPRCVYVPPSSGKSFFSFRISYARCGTKPDLHGQFYENTVVVQYDKDLLEVWDEAKRLRCEWFNDYEKTASKPPMVIADLDVIQLDFRGDNVDCWMEIQQGKGPWGPPVTGIVPIGSTLTLVVAINDFKGEFDMRVKSCVASDGSGHIIKLSDEYGCVLRPKMISKFLKTRSPDEKATVIAYAFFHAFKFPDALSVHIKCTVEICRHGCLEHCQLNNNPYERKDIIDNSVGPDKFDPDRDYYDDNVKQDLSNNDMMEHFLELKKEMPDETDESKFPQGPRSNQKPESRAEAGPRFLRFNQTDMPKIQYRSKRSMAVSDRRVRSADVGVSGLYEVYSETDLEFNPNPKEGDSVTILQGSKIREEVVYGICMPANGFSILFIILISLTVMAALIAGTLLYRYKLHKETIIPNNSFSSWMALRLFRIKQMEQDLKSTLPEQPTAAT